MYVRAFRPFPWIQMLQSSPDVLARSLSVCYLHCSRCRMKPKETGLEKSSKREIIASQLCANTLASPLAPPDRYQPLTSQTWKVPRCSSAVIHNVLGHDCLSQSPNIDPQIHTTKMHLRYPIRLGFFRDSGGAQVRLIACPGGCNNHGLSNCLGNLDRRLLSNGGIFAAG